MSFGKCALCSSVSELRRSHAIPDSFFRRLFSQNSGKAISFIDDQNTEISYTNDSWWEYQLCAECEEIINLKYEKYSINLLRGSGGSFSRKKDGILFSECSNKTIISFITSIVWRAANSKNKAYENIYLMTHENNSIRENLLLDKKITHNIASVRISRLTDNTANGFSPEQLKNLIITPFRRDFYKNKAFCFVLEGFFIEAFVPGVPIKDRKKIGMLDPSKNCFFAPYINVFSIQEIIHSFVSGYRKNAEGMVVL